MGVSINVCKGIRAKRWRCFWKEADEGQAAAVIEGRVPDAGDAVRDRDAGQLAAVVEGIIPDGSDRLARDRVGNNQSS